MPHKALGHIVSLLCTGTYLVQGKEFCFGVNNEQYRCEMGYCCGETHCCTYYYELWWFWLVWTLVIMLSCCCAYRHRRVKMRLQQEQRQREISLMAYQGASSSFVSPPPISLRFWTDCKLPDYEEVVGHPPTPPPPYSESPLEVLPVAHLVEPSSPGSPGGARPVTEQAAGLPARDAAAGASGQPVQQEAEPPEASPSGEEMNTRRRHVTGDSGIEVCVCQIDAGDSSAPEEEEEDQERLCQGASGSCCAERLSGGQRKASYEALAPDACSGGDGLV